jgi:arylsulfatase A
MTQTTQKPTTRRDFLRLASSAGMASLLTPGLLGAVQPNRPPNVILIYTDDQGSIDAGVYGAKDIETPNIDTLAAEGVRFTQFYAPSPVCSPSRAGLLTGKYPLHAGVPGNCSCTPGDPCLAGNQVTLAEVFKNAGYHTAHMGKWHLGFSKDTLPNAQGFDDSFGHMGGCIDNYSHFFYWGGPNRHDLYKNGEEVWREGHFHQDLMLEEASQFIQNHQQQPFFLYFAINAPHYPYQGNEKWLAHYKEKGVPYPRDLYAAFVSTLDETIGTLLKKIDELGLRENTIVVFQSDQGHSVEERAHFGGGSAGILRGAKFSLFEGGIRVPAIIRWPGHVPTGETREQVAHGCDWFPTLADLCGINPIPADLDGLSLVPVIHSNSAPSPHDTLHWYVSGGKEPQWAVRQGDWKLIGYPVDATKPQPLPEEDQLFLVNLAHDQTESRNRAVEFPEQVQALHLLHQNWLATIQSNP